MGGLVVWGLAQAYAMTEESPRIMGAFLADYRWIGPHGIGRFARECCASFTSSAPSP